MNIDTQNGSRGSRRHKWKQQPNEVGECERNSEAGASPALAEGGEASKKATALVRNQRQPSRRHATSARQLTHAQRRLGPRPGSKYNPGAARPAPASDFAHARRHLGPRPGRGCAPEPHSQPSPDDLRTRGDAWARGSGGAVALGATPHRNLARSSGGGGGVGRGGSPLGRSESGRLLAWLPPPRDFLRHPLCTYHNAGPSHIRSASQVAVTARRRDELAPPLEVARPRRDALGWPTGEGKRRGARPKGGEGRGPGDGASPLLSAAPCRTLPPPPLSRRLSRLRSDP